MEQTIVLPSKPRVISEEKDTGVYEIDGLYPGYGHTIGNALRRILLSSLPGAAPTEVIIEGVKHMFSTIPGIKEDVLTILLNIKQLRVRMFSEEPQKIRLQARGAGEVLAKGIQCPAQVEIANPDLRIATLTDKSSALDMEITVERGLGYRSQEIIHKKRVEIGSMVLDAVFTPIRRVNYEVENMRVGDRTDYNRLRINIQTDGTITPREALEEAITTMIQQLKAVVGFVEEPQEEEEAMQISVTKEERGEEVEPQMNEMADVLKVRIEELNFSGRVLNALSNAGIRTVGGLVKKTPEDLLKVEGIGQKAVEDIKQVLGGMGLSLKE